MVTYVRLVAQNKDKKKMAKKEDTKRGHKKMTQKAFPGYHYTKLYDCVSKNWAS